MSARRALDNTKATKKGRSKTYLLLRGLRDLRVLFFAIGLAQQLVTAQTLPDARGVEIVRARCLSCHESDLIVKQRLSRTGWEREVDKMVRWGAIVEAAQRTPLVDYLSANFAPKPVAAHAAATAAAGESTYKQACFSCHEEDLIEQQRLTRAGWVREVDKMIRWGAKVPDTEKDALVDFLTARYGPR